MSETNPTNKPRRRRNNPRKTKTSPKQKASPRNSLRNTQLSQCDHLLTARHFKLFQKGTHLDSYGFIPTGSTLKYNIQIPHDFPRSPIRIQDSNPILSNNFNQWSKKNKDKYNLVSQLNYLVVNREQLSMVHPQEFNNMSTLRTSFYNQFI